MNLAVIEQEVIEACLETGAFIHEESLRFDRSRIEQKEGFNNLVSYVDKESERRLVAALGKIVPGSGFLAEEGTSTKGTNAYRWIIDPLDGTTNFIHGFPVFSVSIAVKVRDQLEVGVVYDPCRQELYTATRGGGAQLDGRRIRVSAWPGLEGALIGTGFPYRSNVEWLPKYMPMLQAVMENTAGVRRPGSAALDLCYVAAGRLDGFWEFGLSSWDIAAGTLLIREAGGLATSLTPARDVLESGNIIAGSPRVHEALHRLLAPHL